MQSLRQLGVGVIIAVASIVLVLGGIFLSLAESLPPPATPTQIPPTFPESFPTPTATPTLIETLTETASPTATVTSLSTETLALFPTVISQLPASCTVPAGWIRITTATGDTIYSLAQRYKTSADRLSAANCLISADMPVGSALYVPPVPTVTVIPCGPPAGWVKTHIVQPGDNLYRIALTYGTTYPQLQRANCMGRSTTIYAGQRLWVPNIPPRTPVPGITIVPELPTNTDTPLAIPTATSSATELPTSIPTALPTALPTATATATPPELPPSQ